MSKQFDFNKIDDFDNHISLSIPNYNCMIDQVVNYIECLSQQNSTVLDIGCSTGNMLKMVDHQPHVTYLGIDNSNLIDDTHQRIIFRKSDIFDFDFNDWGEISVVTSIFTLQFLPLYKRKILLDRIFNKLVEGGVFIITEKVYMDDSQIESINTVNYLNSKRSNFNDTVIMDKAQQLTRTMSLKSESGLIDELSVYGTVIPFWKSYSFSGYIVKGY